MGKLDREMKEYFSDNRRYADLWNGSLFQGRQLICPEDLRENSPVVTYGNKEAHLERTSDLAMKQFRGNQVLALWIVENQENIDYSMPARVMVQEALQYGRQLKEVRLKNRRTYEKHQKESDDGQNPYYKDAGEFLYHFRKQDRISPVITLVVYWGDQQWKGPRTLHDMLNLGGSDELGQELRRLIPDYPLHFINLSGLEDYSLFQTELRTLLELYACRRDKGKFAEYLHTHDECRSMDPGTFHALEVLTHSELLHTYLPKEKEVTVNMCKAIDDLIQDSMAEGMAKGIAEGRAEGKAEGKAEGEARMAQLIQILIDAGQLSVLSQALKDIQLRNQLFQQYQLL